MVDKLLDDIILLIESKMGRNNAPITRATSLESDLGITGDDAVEFLISYSQKFCADVSGLDLKKYFSPEGDFILPLILRLLTGKKEAKDSELTVGDLEKGILAKILNEEIINK